MTTSAPYPDFDDTQPCASVHDPDPFFPISDDGHWAIPEAVAICSDCPFRRPCLAHALTHDVQGIWGGTTEPARKKLRQEHGITAQRVAFSDAAMRNALIDRLDDGTRTVQEIARDAGVSAATVWHRRHLRTAPTEEKP